MIIIDCHMAGIMEPSKKKARRECHFDSGWIQEFSGIRKSSKGNTYAQCSFCSSDFSISHGGRNDVTTHVGGKHHQEAIRASSSSRSLSSMFTSSSRSSLAESTIEAEVRWAMFVAKHNVAFLTSDHASRLFSKMFPDSAIAKKFGCGHTKTTAIIKEALAPYYLNKVLSSMSNPFSLMMDESNDKTDKSCIILVRTLDTKLGEVRSRFLDMPIVNIGNAANLFNALKLSLSKHNLDFSNSVAFMSDTTNVMKGARSGIQKLISNEHPDIYDVGCICHLADLTVKAGMQALPVNIDQLLIDVFYYFQHSSKRKQNFVDHWNSLFSDEPGVILKHCTTRWLSLLRCVGRYISQMEGLKSYFLSCKVVSISDRLANPLTKPLLLFLSHILLSMDRFNRVFQKSTENTTSQLYTEMSRLTRLYASNVLQRSAITSVGDYLRKLNLDISFQLPDENFGIGTDTWTCLSELQEEYDLKPFFTAVRGFYIATLKKMLKKFPFGDSLLKDLSVLQPDKTSTFSDNVLVNLAKRF